MERWKKGVLGVFLVVVLDVIMYHFLQHEVGWVPLGLISFGLLYLAVRFARYSREELGFGGSFDFKIHILLPVAFMLLYFVWVFPLGIGLNTFDRPLNVAMLIYLAMLIKYLIFVALFEEITWRGLFQRALEDRLGKGWKAVFITAILFALWHLPSRPSFWRFYNPFMVGLAWGVYRWKFRRLEGLILAHGLGDFLDRIMTIEKLEWLTGTTWGVVYWVGTFTITAIAEILIYIWVAKRLEIGGGELYESVHNPDERG